MSQADKELKVSQDHIETLFQKQTKKDTVTPRIDIALNSKTTNLSYVRAAELRKIPLKKKK